MSRDRAILGDYNVICDRTGFKVKRSECRRTWDGFLVRKEDWEPRHPMDFLKPRPERQRVRDARPEQPIRTAPAIRTADDL